jgi:hypothetical protein
MFLCSCLFSILSYSYFIDNDTRSTYTISLSTRDFSLGLIYTYTHEHTIDQLSYELVSLFDMQCVSSKSKNQCHTLPVPLSIHVRYQTWVDMSRCIRQWWTSVAIARINYTMTKQSSASLNSSLKTLAIIEGKLNSSRTCTECNHLHVYVKYTVISNNLIR